MNRVLKLHKTLIKLPFGKRLFSLAVARIAPYFLTIKPTIEDIRPNAITVSMKKRPAVYNHLKTVHAIASCNLCEFAAGVVMEASIPKHLRWIPKGMELSYPAKADSDLVCEAISDPSTWVPGDLPIKVTARRKDGTAVVEGVIKLWISEKPKR